MAAELRWILLALSLVLLAGIWWWGRRRSTQAPGNAALREITPTADPVRHEPPAAEALSDVETAPDAQAREWGVPPFEPLSIHTQEYDHVPILDGPMMVDVDPAPALSPGGISAGAADVGPGRPGLGRARPAPRGRPRRCPGACQRCCRSPAIERRWLRKPPT